MFKSDRRWIVLALIGLVCLSRGQTVRSRQSSEGNAAAKKSVGPALSDQSPCSDCHQEEVVGFARSKMSRSLRLSDQEPRGVVEVSGSVIKVESDRTGTRQSLDSHGHIEKYPVAYVIGSGTHASGYIISLSDHLFQSPIAYYRQRGAYGLAPGYENKSDPDFTRPIGTGCLFYHAGGFNAVAGTENQYATKPFSHLAIDCSRCHGPTEGHLSHPGRATIVNPARLSAAARDSVCEQCHLKGAARVLNPGKKFTDFVPGRPLEETFTIYRYTMPEDAEPPFKVISHSEEFARSLCKRASGDGMWCGTCHDPHHEPVDAIPYYRGKCLQCHAETKFASTHPNLASNCIGCHMPKKQTNDGGHTVFTDHRIQRRSTDIASVEPNGIAAWREPAADVAKRNLGIAEIEAGMAEKSWPQIVKGYRTLTDVQRQFSEDSEMYEHMGEALLIGHQYEEAVQAFELAVRYDPQSSAKEASLGSAYAGLGKNDLAEMHFERSLKIDALNLSAAELLIGLYGNDGQQAKEEQLKGSIARLLQQ